MVCPFQHAIETLVALVVAHETDEVRGIYPVLGFTVMASQVGVGGGGV